ncbi:hypothetical protein [Xanthomarina gelatinilytica]|uniref:hypothetical protein n=1 Tax=Xanthomarina gelatinilytica TaxID=1137281 RepID=UPI003AA7DB69
MYKIGGALLILISLAICINSYKKFDAIQNGKEVEVRVIDVPVSCEVSNRTLKSYFRFEYNDKEYTKNIKGEYCDILKRAKTINLKTNTDNSVFVYPNEKLTMQYITVFSLLIIGIVFLFKKSKK